MTIERIIFFGVNLALFACLTYGFLIKKNIIKPNKISRAFYQDDEYFIDSWKKTREKGLLRYIIKSIIFATVLTGILGIVSIFYKPQGMTMLYFLTLGPIIGLIYCMSWRDNQYRYKKLKEK
ncbi:MAG: hypothetical protein ACM3X7_05700 [Solirubrobacterales bacterium]